MVTADLSQDLGKGDFREEAEGVVALQAIAGGGGTRKAAEETSQLPGRAQSRMAFVPESADDTQVVEGDFRERAPGKFEGCSPGGEAILTMPARSLRLFAEVAQEVIGRAAGIGRHLQDLFEAIEIILFPAAKEFQQPSGDGTGGFAPDVGQQPIAVAHPAWLQLNLPGLLEILQGFEDALRGFAQTLGGGSRFQGHPARTFLRRAEKSSEKILPGRSMAAKDALYFLDEAPTMTAVKGPERLDDPVLFEISQHRIEDQWANIGRAGKLVTTDGKLITLTQEVINQ
jgi:hypothetical protein